MTKPQIIVVNEEDEVIGHKERGTITDKDIYRVSALWIKDLRVNPEKYLKGLDWSLENL